MPAALVVLLPQIISLLPMVTTGISEMVAWLHKVRAAHRQTGEWTPEMEEAFIAGLTARAVGDAAYRPDAGSQS